MRPIPLIALLIGLAVIPEPTALDIAATAAATLLEATPFILAAWALGRILPGASRWAALLGCGCGGGPAACSLPAAVATWLTFGPVVAVARFAAAWASAVLPTKPCHPERSDQRERSRRARGAPSPLASLASLLPFAIVAGVVSHALPMLYPLAHASPIIAGIAGAVLGLALAPCGLGVVGIAGALRAVCPAACVGFLITAGIIDVRSLLAHHQHHTGHDGRAYLLAAIACAFVAWHGGAALVHPRFVLPLFASAATLVALAYKHRCVREIRALLAPSLLLAIAIAGAPAPTYRATPTTLADAFPGEHLAFTGVVARDGNLTSLVRYAITCCRADAAPISILLANAESARIGSWLQADGTLVTVDGALRLHVEHETIVAPPGDPYLYR